MSLDWLESMGGMDRAGNVGRAQAEETLKGRKPTGPIDGGGDLKERVALMLRSIVTLCERKGLFTEEEFRQIVDEIDFSDGKRDGKLTETVQPIACPQCGKVNAHKALKCMYCGQDLPRQTVL